MSDATSAGLAQLIKDQGSDLGLSPDSSSTIIGNLGGSVTPMCTFHPLTEDEEDSDDHRLLVFGFDGSGSMADVEDELRNSVNDVVIPGLCSDVLDAGLVGGIRVGGVAFSSQVRDLWGGGVVPIRNLPKLTRSDYYSGGMTALHQAVLNMITIATLQALQMSQKTGTHPEVTLACWSDGANNEPPYDADEIKRAMEELDPEIFTTVFIGFETKWGSDDFTDIARGLGFREIQEVKSKPGESLEDQQKRFRNAMGVFSQNLIKRASSSTVGVSVGDDGSTGFWQ